MNCSAVGLLLKPTELVSYCYTVTAVRGTVSAQFFSWRDNCSVFSCVLSARAGEAPSSAAVRPTRQVEVLRLFLLGSKY